MQLYKPSCYKRVYNYKHEVLVLYLGVQGLEPMEIDVCARTAWSAKLGVCVGLSTHILKTTAAIYTKFCTKEDVVLAIGFRLFRIQKVTSGHVTPYGRSLPAMLKVLEGVISRLWRNN